MKSSKPNPSAHQVHTMARNAGNSKEWLTPREAADYLNVGIDLIYDACAAGGLRHAKLGHRTIRLKRAWVDAWVDGKAEQFS